MTRDEFLSLVETYGADLERWPEPSQQGARNLKESDPDFTEPLLVEEKALDEALEAARITPGTDMLKARILNAAKISSALSPVTANAAPQGMRYRAVAAMMTLSFVFGFAGANFMNSGEPENTVSVKADNEWEEFADDYGISELYEWVEQDALP